jgi:hypothetical protein
MDLWTLLSDVGHNWFACSLYCFSMGLLMGLFLANCYHTVRCKSKKHRRNWFLELMGGYDK